MLCMPALVQFEQAGQDYLGIRRRCRRSPRPRRRRRRWIRRCKRRRRRI